MAWRRARNRLVFRAARFPVTVDNDRVALETIIGRVTDLSRFRMARIKNTLELERFWVSQAVRAELRGRPNIAVEEAPRQMGFDAEGRLLPF